MPVPSWNAVIRQLQSQGHSYLDVKLQNRHRIKGHLLSVEPQYCVLENRRQQVSIPYDQIESVQWQQNAFSRGTKIVLIAVVAGAIFLIVAGLELRKS
jgi:small nuclear ribonucleoprotein (snRNP)-like protein